MKKPTMNAATIITILNAAPTTQHPSPPNAATIKTMSAASPDRHTGLTHQDPVASRNNNSSSPPFCPRLHGTLFGLFQTLSASHSLFPQNEGLIRHSSFVHPINHPLSPWSSLTVSDPHHGHFIRGVINKLSLKLLPGIGIMGPFIL